MRSEACFHKTRKKKSSLQRMAELFLHESDEMLIERYRKNGDKEVVGMLFKRHTLMCFAVCRKYLKDDDAAEDAVMAVVEKLFTDLLKHDIKNFKSWLHSVCRNYCLMELRKPAPAFSLNDTEEENDARFMEIDTLLHQEENDGAKEEKLQTLEQAITQLNEKQRQCIELFYLQQKSYEEVSRITGYSAMDVKSALQNGKRNLKIIMGKSGIAFCLIVLEWILHTA